MMSLYTSAVLTTAMVAGVTAYAISESRKDPVFAVDSAAIVQAHRYAMHKGEAAFPPATGVTAVNEVNLGPFFQNGRARSFFRSEYDSSLPSSYPYRTAQVTWYEARNSAEAHRLVSRMSLDEKTRAGIYGEDERGIGGEPIPQIGQSIPAGSVVVISED